jgi:hypothetical protein
MWLTWQGIKALADVDAAKDGDRVRYVALGGEHPKLSVPTFDGMVVHARDSWRHPWRTSLAQVPHRCTLVTVFNDAHVQPHALELFNGKVQHWFAVQVNTTHPRLTAMPIGIDGRDLPTLLEAPRRAWEDRDIVCLANFQERNPERKALLTWCRAQPWIATDRWRGMGTPRTHAEYYALLGRTQFVLSPPGRGWDCYRTYEALAMGAVPIVRRHEVVSDVVDGLPVVVVDRWRDLVPGLCARGRPAGSLERITQAYWTERIVRHGADIQGADPSGG